MRIVWTFCHRSIQDAFAIANLYGRVCDYQCWNTAGVLGYIVFRQYLLRVGFGGGSRTMKYIRLHIEFQIASGRAEKTQMNK